MTKTILYLFLFILTATLVLGAYGEGYYGDYYYGETRPQPSTVSTSSGGGGGGGGGAGAPSATLTGTHKWLLDGQRTIFDLTSIPSKTTKAIKVELKEKSLLPVEFTYTDLKTFEAIPDFKSSNQFEFKSDATINNVEFTIEVPNLKNPQVLHLIGSFWKDEPITSYVNGILKFKVSSLSKFAIGEYTTTNIVPQNITNETTVFIPKYIGTPVESTEPIVEEQTKEETITEEKPSNNWLLGLGILAVFIIIIVVSMFYLNKNKKKDEENN